MVGWAVGWGSLEGVVAEAVIPEITAGCGVGAPGGDVIAQTVIPNPRFPSLATLGNPFSYKRRASRYDRTGIRAWRHREERGGGATPIVEGCLFSSLASVWEAQAEGRASPRGGSSAEERLAQSLQS